MVLMSEDFLLILQKKRIKAVLFHNGNKHTSMPVGHAVHLKPNMIEKTDCFQIRAENYIKDTRQISNNLLKIFLQTCVIFYSYLSPEFFLSSTNANIE